MLELEALAALAKNANARLYIGFDKHLAPMRPSTGIEWLKLMLRDPLYLQIRRRLRELKDGNAFQLTPFEKLMQHPDARLRKVGQIGFEYFSKLKAEQLTHEKRAAIRGESG